MKNLVREILGPQRRLIVAAAVWCLGVVLAVFIARTMMPAPELAMATVTPAVITGGHVAAMQSGDTLALPGNETATGTVAIGTTAAFRVGEKLAIKGTANQLSLENATGPTPSQFLIESNGDTLWDISPTPVVATDPQTIRVFRRTATSGDTSMDFLNPNTSTVRARIDPTGTALAGRSFFIFPVGFGTGVPAYPVTAVQASGTNQTVSNRIGSFVTSGSALTYSFDTTAGAITTAGIFVRNDADRAAGANPLTNVGAYLESSTGQLNYGLVVDNADVDIETHLLGSGTGPTVSGCGGTVAVDSGDDKWGTVTEGAISTGCVISFAIPYTTIIPSCTVTSRAGLIFTYSVSLTALTIVNVGALSTTTLDYNCGGHLAATPVPPEAPASAEPAVCRPNDTP